MDDATILEKSCPIAEEQVKIENTPPDESPQEECVDNAPDTSVTNNQPHECSGSKDNDSSYAEPNPPILSDESSMLCEIRNEIEKVSNSVSEIAEATRRTTSEIKEIHKLYHNEFAGRLKSMQEELDEYHKVDRGRAFDVILSAIARIYGNNETLVKEITDAKTQKHVRYLLLDLLDLLEEYGVQRIKSNPGDKRNTRHSQVLERIPTNDEAKHDTVAKSHNSGFFIDNRTIIKETVDVYLFDSESKVQAQESALPICDTSTTTAEQNN